MADSENSRTLPKISCANAFPNETFVDNMPSVINRRNLLPLAARILPMVGTVSLSRRSGIWRRGLALTLRREHVWSC